MIYYLFLHVKLGADAENFKLYSEDFFSFPVISSIEQEQNKNCEDLHLSLFSEDEKQLTLKLESEKLKSETAELKVFEDGILQNQIVFSNLDMQSVFIYYPAFPYCDLSFEIKTLQGIEECNLENNRLHLKASL